jgi:hypothetical protein
MTVDTEDLLSEALDDIRKAIDLYRSDERANRELITASYNTFAYMLALKASVNGRNLAFAVDYVTEAR